MIRQKSFECEVATLYLVPTPIGNLQEMTTRALDILQKVDMIACEDTRNTKKLLMAYSIDKPLISHHEHNQATSIPYILTKLEDGNSIAVVSDAGYPLVSDPGQGLVKAVIEKGYPVVPVSGANAAMNALVASGLSCQHYMFYGFLENKSTKRIKQLETLKTFPYTIIFYEAPHRIEAMLQDVLDVMGDRNICLARELTKIHEEFIRGKISEVLEVVDSLKGEMVVIVEGYVEKEQELDWGKLFDKVHQYVDEGMKTKQAIQLVSKECNVSKNELYEAYHKQ